MIFFWQYQGQFGSNGPPLVLVGSVVLLISSLLVVLLGDSVYPTFRLATDGLPATGTVMKKTMHHADDRGIENSSYQVDYLFTTADGRSVPGSDTVDPSAWDQITEGARVPVEYAATQPSIHRIGAAAKLPIGGCLALAGASLLWLLGGALAVKGLRMTRAARARARASGSAALLEETPDPILMKALAVMLPWVNPLNVFAVVALFMGMAFLPIGLAGVHREQLFRSEGETVAGTVLTKSVRTEVQQQGRRVEKHYDVGYRFITHAGSSVQGSDDVPLPPWRSIREREPIQIIYLPEHPARSRLLANDPGTVPEFFRVLGPTLLAVAAILVGYRVCSSIRRRRHGPNLRFSG
jgi:hypothetical protein